MKHTFTGTIEGDGVFVPNDYPSYRQHIDGLLAKSKRIDGSSVEFEMTLERKVYRRSSAQNNYMWGVMYATVLPVLQKNSDRPITLDMVHEWAKAMFLPINMVVPGIDGVGTEQTVVIGGSTKKLTTMTFGDFKDAFQVWWAARGVVVADPDQREWLNILDELNGNEEENT